jgi:hypothetical protein
MPGAAAATITANSLGLMIGRHWGLCPEFRRQSDRSRFDRGAIACMRGCVRMCVWSAAMGSRTGRRKRDQEKR